MALVFGLPSVVSIILTRIYLLPFIPDETSSRIQSFTVTRNIFLLLIFAGLMILASYKMISKKYFRRNCWNAVQKIRIVLLLAAGQGSIVGVFNRIGRRRRRFYDNPGIGQPIKSAQ
jgi:hypothetical protein